MGAEAARRASEQGRPPEARDSSESSVVNTGQDRDIAFPPPSAERLQASRQREAPSQEFALRPQGNNAPAAAASSSGYGSGRPPSPPRSLENSFVSSPPPLASQASAPQPRPAA